MQMEFDFERWPTGILKRVNCEFDLRGSLSSPFFVEKIYI